MEYETLAIHAGQDPDTATGAAVVPIYATSTYVQAAPGDHLGYEYSRTDNPTRQALEDAIAALEGVGEGGGAIATASGMAATALIGYLMEPGDHVVMPDDAYGGTHRFFARVLRPQSGVDVTVADLTDLDAVKAAIRPETKVMWIETPTNPLLRVVDVPAVTALAHEAGALVVVDNTFATSFLLRPLEMGADMVLYSTTKYLGGHSDVIGGALVANDAELFERLRFLRNAAGPVPGPFDCYLVLRGLKTLAIRMERHSLNGMAVAQFLAGHSAVAEVGYPGLPDDPGYEVASAQMRGYGGMVWFRPEGGAEAAHRIVSSTKLFFLAESLGGVESLIEVPAPMTHASVAGTQLEIPDDFVRVSVGIENSADLIADLDQALR